MNVISDNVYCLDSIDRVVAGIFSLIERECNNSGKEYQEKSRNRSRSKRGQPGFLMGNHSNPVHLVSFLNGL
jgi:hypothetical protein